jgi:hypothetical protein
MNGLFDKNASIRAERDLDDVLLLDELYPKDCLLAAKQTSVIKHYVSKVSCDKLASWLHLVLFSRFRSLLLLCSVQRWRVVAGSLLLHYHWMSYMLLILGSSLPYRLPQKT